jgi:TonB family protein
MNLATLVLAAAAATLCADACAARGADPQQAMTLDLNTCPRPVWPAAALAAGVKGKTTVEARIGDTGRVTDARVAVSSGRADLDEAALAGIRSCLFRAVLAAGEAPTGWLKTQYVWVPGTAAKEIVDDALFADTRQRADDGDAIAQNQLGIWAERGTRDKADPAQAAAWYLLAAQAGNANAQNNLGVLYFRGKGVPLDRTQAVHWYEKAAEQGHGWAQANLVWAYENGSAVALDVDQATYWLTRSAEGGLAPSQVRLALLSMKHAASDGERSAAAAWLERAAAQHFVPAFYYLGRSFELGLGNAQDDALAAAWYRQALGRSDGRAEVALGMLIEAGRATAADGEDATALYAKAMQSRYPAAYYRYGLALKQRGELGVAAIVLLSGAEQGDCDATLEYVQARQALGTMLVSDGSAGDWDGRAEACRARPAVPVQL